MSNDATRTSVGLMKTSRSAIVTLEASAAADYGMPGCFDWKYPHAVWTTAENHRSVVRRRCGDAEIERSGGSLRPGLVTLQAQSPPPPDFEKLPFAPRRAICYRTPTPLQIDGRLSEPAWSGAPWSDPFVDIEGTVAPRSPPASRCSGTTSSCTSRPISKNRTSGGRSKARDSVIFQDNDFEIFIDPDGDTHAYYEIEINALNTVWDLMLIQPYRDGGPAMHAWDIAGLRRQWISVARSTGPDDRDEGWSVEMAMPWAMLEEAAPRRAPPRAGEQWRVNFSRVQWQLDVARWSIRQAVDAKTASRCPRTTGSGVHRGRSTCTCPSGGAWSSSRTPLPANGPRRLSRTAMTGSNGRCGASTTGNAHTARPMAGIAHDLSLLNAGDIHVEGHRLQADRAGDGLAV